MKYEPISEVDINIRDFYFGDQAPTDLKFPLAVLGKEVDAQAQMTGLLALKRGQLLFLIGPV